MDLTIFLHQFNFSIAKAFRSTLVPVLVRLWSLFWSGIGLRFGPSLVPRSGNLYYSFGPISVPLQLTSIGGGWGSGGGGVA